MGKLRNTAINWMVCTAGRTGSSWLAEVLRDCRFLGCAEEYFNNNGNPWNEGPMALQFDAKEITADAYWDRVCRRDASPDGVQGVKVAYRDYELVRDTIHPTHAVHLIRRDRIAQAVSLYRAEASGTWEGTGDLPPLLCQNPCQNLRQNVFPVLDSLRSILSVDHGFVQKLREDRIPFITISYESLLEFGPKLTLCRIAHHLGVKMSEHLEPRWKSKPYRDDWNQRMVDSVRWELGLEPKDILRKTSEAEPD